MLESGEIQLPISRGTPYANGNAPSRTCADPQGFNGSAVVVITHTGHRLAAHGRAFRVAEARSRRQHDDFVRVPWRIYRDDPKWVPPLLVERKAFIHPAKHPFYQHGGGGAVCSLQRARTRSGESSSPMTRTSTSIKRRTPAAFGMFESIDDVDVAYRLLDAAQRWLRGRAATPSSVRWTTR